MNVSHRTSAVRALAPLTSVTTAYVCHRKRANGQTGKWYWYWYLQWYWYLYWYWYWPIVNGDGNGNGGVKMLTGK